MKKLLRFLGVLVLLAAVGVAFFSGSQLWQGRLSLPENVNVPESALESFDFELVGADARLENGIYMVDKFTLEELENFDMYIRVNNPPVEDTERYGEVKAYYKNSTDSINVDGMTFDIDLYSPWPLEFRKEFDLAEHYIYGKILIGITIEGPAGEKLTKNYLFVPKIDFSGIFMLNENRESNEVLALDLSGINSNIRQLPTLRLPENVADLLAENLSINNQEVACRALSQRSNGRPVIVFNPNGDEEVEVTDSNYNVEARICAPSGYLSEVKIEQSSTANGLIRVLLDEEFEANDEVIVKNFEIPTTLRDGVNNITITAVARNLDNEAISTVGTFPVRYEDNNNADSEDPVITVSTTRQNDDRVTVRGRITDNEGVARSFYQVNGVREGDIDLESDGDFTFTADLPLVGRNVVTLVAFDAANNQATYNVRLERERDNGDDDEDEDDEDSDNEFGLSISYDDDNPFDLSVRNTEELDVLIVNLYEVGDRNPILNVFYHCRRDTYSGCPAYERNRLNVGRHNYDITDQALRFLDEGRYYYKAVGVLADDQVSVESDTFRFEYDDFDDFDFDERRAADGLCYNYFTDLRGISTEDCVDIATVREYGIFTGVPTGNGSFNFAPSEILKRNQLAAVAVRFGQFPPASYNPRIDGDLGFPDLGQYVQNPDAFWFMDAFKQALVYGGKQILQGDRGLMMPTREITVAEAYKVIIESAVVGQKLAVARPNINQNKQVWWADYDRWFGQVGLPQIGPDGNRPISRLEVARFFSAMYERGLVRR